MFHETQYTARRSRLQWRVALLVAVAPAAAGCVGLSIPLGEVNGGVPVITGSIKADQALPRPLPAGLAELDAMAISEAARRALAAENSPARQDWRDPATGSSGTLTVLGEAEEEGGETCRNYAATVASLKGVHRYICRACRGADGAVTVRSIAAVVETASAAGI